MLTGIGDTWAKTLNLAGGATAQRMIELNLYEMEYGSEAETIEALAYTAGKRRTKSSAQGTITDTLTLRTQFVNWANLGFAFDSFPKIAASDTVLILKNATVPSASPYEIADAAITSANTNNIFAYINTTGVWGQAAYLPRATTAATPSAGQAGVDTTNNKLIFNSAQAGALISYVVPEAKTNIEHYGGSGAATRYGKIEYHGRLYTPESTNTWRIWFPELTRQSRPSLSFTGDVPVIQVVFGCSTPPGWDEPFKVWNMDTGS